MAALDAMKLAERLQGLKRDEYWLHLEAAGPLEKYPAKQHARRVRDKLDATSGLISLSGQLARNNADSDMPAPFRQLRYFYYLSGCNEPNCHLTYDIQHDTLALFIPRIDPRRVIWNGRGSTPVEALDKYDIDSVYFIDELQACVQAWSMRNRGDIYILHPPLTASTLYPIDRLDSTSLQPAMDLVRMIKDDHEIKLIRKANDISSEAHKQVLANITKFKNEAQVEGLFVNVCTSRQAKQQAYDVIAASGPNAGTLHYDANNEDFGDRQLICLDAGCEYKLYASDITRTFPLSGSWPSAEAENIYKLVQRMQDVCIKRMEPGVRYLDLHILAHQIAIDGLLQLGILHNGTREEIYKAGTSRAFFPHGLGHHVGLEVHDVGQRELMSACKRNIKHEKAPSLYPENFHVPVYDKELCHAPTDPHSPHIEEGMVITVEPGIYFSAYALSYFYLPSPIHSRYINTKVLTKYLPVGGVRIEDDILITGRGHENLTSAPKGEAMLEIIRNQNARWPFVPEVTGAPQVPPSDNQCNDVLQEPLRRAPGISKRVSQPRLKSILRAATAPVEPPRKRNSVDFEPFDGPSLFTGFKRSTTTDENVERWRESRLSQKRPATNREDHLPLCGESSPNCQHIYMASHSHPKIDFVIAANRHNKPMETCKKCAVLSQTLSRLRKQLQQSERAPKTDIQSMASPEPAARRKPEMQQVRSHRRHRNADVSLDSQQAVSSNNRREPPALVPFDPHWDGENHMSSKFSTNPAYTSSELHSLEPLGMDIFGVPSSTVSNPTADETIPLRQEHRTHPNPHCQPQMAPLQSLPGSGIVPPWEHKREIPQITKGISARASLPSLGREHADLSSRTKPPTHWHGTTAQTHRHPSFLYSPVSHHSLASQPLSDAPPRLTHPSEYAHMLPSRSEAGDMEQKIEDLHRAMDNYCRIMDDIERSRRPSG